MPSELACSDIINHARYPIDRPDDPRRKNIIEQVRPEPVD